MARIERGAAMPEPGDENEKIDGGMSYKSSEDIDKELEDIIAQEDAVRLGQDIVEETFGDTEAEVHNLQERAEQVGVNEEEQEEIDSLTGNLSETIQKEQRGLIKEFVDVEPEVLDKRVKEAADFIKNNEGASVEDFNENFGLDEETGSLYFSLARTFGKNREKLVENDQEKAKKEQLGKVVGSLVENAKSTETEEGDEVEIGVEQEPLDIEVGNYVQWKSQGVDQFPKPKKVTAISEDKKYVFVENSHTGLPADEIEKVEKEEEATNTEEGSGNTDASAGDTAQNKSDYDGWKQYVEKEKQVINEAKRKEQAGVTAQVETIFAAARGPESARPEEIRSSPAGIEARTRRAQIFGQNRERHISRTSEQVGGVRFERLVRNRVHDMTSGFNSILASQGLRSLTQSLFKSENMEPAQIDADAAARLAGRFVRRSGGFFGFAKRMFGIDQPFRRVGTRILRAPLTAAYAVGSRVDDMVSAAATYVERPIAQFRSHRAQVQERAALRQLETGRSVDVERVQGFINKTREMQGRLDRVNTPVTERDRT